MTGEVTWRVPGRIEVLGKHTDYAGGRVLVGAIDRGVTVTATPGGAGIEASTDAFADAVSLAAGVDPGLPEGHWGRYVQTAIDRLTANFGALAPCRLRIESDLPPASGMSSSSAVLCGVSLALADLNGLTRTGAWQQACPDRLALAGYLACVENGRSWRTLAGASGVGTFGGSEDHAAMLCGGVGELLELSFDPPAELGRVPLAPGLTFVVAVSGVLAEKSGAAREAYNGASLAAASVVRRYDERTGGRHDSLAGVIRSLTSGVAVSDAVGAAGVGARREQPDADALAPLRAATADDPRLSARLEHFIEESTRLVPEAARALASGDLDAFGTLAERSQRAAETLLGNQVPQTIALAASARAFGAHAASAFGAGFGGSVWALVDEADASGFAAAWHERYRREFPGQSGSATLVTRPGAGARRLA